ncbi:21213_t:CDS:1, partial [Racocetra persica]
TMKTHFIEKHNEIWCQIRYHPFNRPRADNKKHSIIFYFRKNKCLVCGYMFQTNPKVSTMKKHFATKHNGDWREYVKNRKFNKKLLLAQEIVKKSVKKPDTSNPIRKLQNTKSVEKKNIVRGNKNFKKPYVIVKKSDPPVTDLNREIMNKYFNQYDMIDMFCCNFCKEVISPELLRLHLILKCKHRL